MFIAYDFGSLIVKKVCIAQCTPSKMGANVDKRLYLLLVRTRQGGQASSLMPLYS